MKVRRLTNSWSLLLLFVLISLTACSSQPEQQHHKQQPTQTGALQISFHTQPGHPKVKEAVKLTADIQQGNQPVNDAQVKFEFWSTPDNKQTIDTKRIKPGQYQAISSFPQTGTYQVIIHVVTPQTHQMKTNQFTVSQ